MTTEVRRSRLTLVTVLLLGLAPAAAEASPWGNLALFKRIEADPAKSYRLTEDNGPWMVLAQTFRGSGADRRAHELVLELRKRFKLESYTFVKEFDFTQRVVGKHVNKYGGPKLGRYANNKRVREVAVLVGNYATVDEPAAQKMLEKIRHLMPDTLTRAAAPADETDSAWRKFRQAILRKRKDKSKGPMGTAFVTKNPLLPEEYFKPQGVDPTVLAMNQGVKYSLLDCPGSYSVRVATFTGRKAVGQAAIDKYERAGNTNTLIEAAEKAHTMTLALRKKGYQAYEFHDRFASFVTVGSFDSAGTPRSDGKTEINPKINALINTFRAESAPAPQGARGGAFGARLKYTAGIAHDIQPWIIRVPKRTLAATYAGRPR